MKNSFKFILMFVVMTFVLSGCGALDGLFGGGGDDAVSTTGETVNLTAVAADTLSALPGIASSALPSFKSQDASASAESTYLALLTESQIVNMLFNGLPSLDDIICEIGGTEACSVPNGNYVYIVLTCDGEPSASSCNVNGYGTGSNDFTGISAATITIGYENGTLTFDTVVTEGDSETVTVNVKSATDVNFNLSGEYDIEFFDNPPDSLSSSTGKAQDSEPGQPNTGHGKPGNFDGDAFKEACAQEPMVIFQDGTSLEIIMPCTGGQVLDKCSIGFFKDDKTTEGSSAPDAAYKIECPVNFNENQCDIQGQVTLAGYVSFGDDKKTYLKGQQVLNLEFAGECDEKLGGKKIGDSPDTAAIGKRQTSPQINKLNQVQWFKARLVGKVKGAMTGECAIADTEIGYNVPVQTGPVNFGPNCSEEFIKGKLVSWFGFSGNDVEKFMRGELISVSGKVGVSGTECYAQIENEENTSDETTYTTFQKVTGLNEDFFGEEELENGHKGCHFFCGWGDGGSKVEAAFWRWMYDDASGCGYGYHFDTGFFEDNADTFFTEAPACPGEGALSSVGGQGGEAAYDSFGPAESEEDGTCDSFAAGVFRSASTEFEGTVVINGSGQIDVKIKADGEEFFEIDAFDPYNIAGDTQTDDGLYYWVDQFFNPDGSHEVCVMLDKFDDATGCSTNLRICGLIESDCSSAIEDVKLPDEIKIQLTEFEQGWWTWNETTGESEFEECSIGDAALDEFYGGGDGVIFVQAVFEKIEQEDMPENGATKMQMSSNPDDDMKYENQGTSVGTDGEDYPEGYMGPDHGEHDGSQSTDDMMYEDAKPMDEMGDHRSPIKLSSLELVNENGDVVWKLTEGVESHLPPSYGGGVVVEFNGYWTADPEGNNFPTQGDMDIFCRIEVYSDSGYADCRVHVWSNSCEANAFGYKDVQFEVKNE